MMTEKKKSERKVTVPDTNIFLHFQSLETIDLLEIMNCQSALVLITPAVIDELDEIKWNHGRKGIRDRASKSLFRIKKWLGHPKSEIRTGVSVEVSAYPSKDTFNSHMLDERSGDDLILASILEWKETGTGEDIILLTNDVGPQLRARKHNISVLELTENLTLPATTDPQQRELIRLQQELSEYKLRSPDLDLFLFEKQVEGNVSILAPIEFNEAEAKRFAKEKVQAILDSLPDEPNYPSDLENIPDGFANIARSLALLGSIPEEEKKRFAKDLSNYEANYYSYLKRYNEAENWGRRSIRYTLNLVNSGTSIAEDLIVRVILPSFMVWNTPANEVLFPKEPKKPTPPQLNLMSWNIDRGFGDFLPDVAPTGEKIEDPDEAKLRFIDNTAEFTLRRLHHGNRFVFPDVIATFKSISEVRTHQLDFTLQERNTPQVIEGRLLIKAEKAS